MQCLGEAFGCFDTFPVLNAICEEVFKFFEILGIFDILLGSLISTFLGITGVSLMKYLIFKFFLSANKYFKIMNEAKESKLAFDTKIPRLTHGIDSIPYSKVGFWLHTVFSFFDFSTETHINHPDDCIYPEDEKPRSNGTLPSCHRSQESLLMPSLTTTRF